MTARRTQEGLKRSQLDCHGEPGSGLDACNAPKGIRNLGVPSGPGHWQGPGGLLLEEGMRKLRLDNRQLEILKYVYSALKMQGDLAYLESRLDVDGENFVVIHGFLAIADLGTMNVLFNLPTKTSSVFLAIAENSFAEVARILANVEDYQRATGRRIAYGETMDLDGTWPSLLAQEASALIFLPCSVSLDLEPLTDDFLLDDETVTFALAVPVTDDDIRIRHEQGLDVLFSTWDEVGKDIMI